MKSQALLFFALALSSLAGAQPVNSGAQRVQYSGTLGQSRIGLTVVVENGQATHGHYFYGKYLTDIPLEASQAHDGLELKEAQGVFHLRFKGNGSEGGKPLNFDNSVGLDGTWTAKDGRTLPVQLTIETVLQGATGPRYADVTTYSDAAFEERIVVFYNAVLDGNREIAARYVSYPLRVNAKSSRTIKTPQAFIAAWNSIFTPDFLARLRNDLPHDMFVRNGMAMLGSGDVWFDGKGAAVLNIGN